MTLSTEAGVAADAGDLAEAGEGKPADRYWEPLGARSFGFLEAVAVALLAIGWLALLS